MAVSFQMDVHVFYALAALPVVGLGLYTFLVRPRLVENRLFALFAATWTTWSVTLNLVGEAKDLPTAITLTRVSVYSGLLVIPFLLHFVLMFPYRSSLLKHVWLIPLLYVSSAVSLVALYMREDTMVRLPSQPSDWPEARPALFFFLTLAFTMSVLLLLLRYTLTDLQVNRRRIFFVMFALATYSLYNGIGTVHVNNNAAYVGSFVGEDDTYWRLTTATDALLILTYFSVLALLAFRTLDGRRRREAWWLIGGGFTAVLTGYVDPVVGLSFRRYAATLWVWEIATASLMFYGILRFQLFDLDKRIRRAAQIASFCFVAAILALVGGGVLSNLNGAWWGYPLGLAIGASFALVPPIRRNAGKWVLRMFPETSSDIDARKHAVDVYRAALEGALVDKRYQARELTELSRMRNELGITDQEHRQLERDIRGRLVQGGA